jgi:hypothetical protein
MAPFPNFQHAITVTLFVEVLKLYRIFAAYNIFPKNLGDSLTDKIAKAASSIMKMIMNSYL